MRIISGYHKGRQLKGPSSSKIRPTTDRIRESLFSILGPIDDVIVVDGFAGTGALGCEAISRGAKHVYFFDASSEALQLIQANVAQVQSPHKVTIKKVPFVRGIKDTLSMEPDLIFLDPPYGKPQLVAQALEAIEQSALVTEGTLVVLEQESSDEMPQVSAVFELDDERRYGRTRLTFWRVVRDVSEVEG